MKWYLQEEAEECYREREILQTKLEHSSLFNIGLLIVIAMLLFTLAIYT